MEPGVLHCMHLHSINNIAAMLKQGLTGATCCCLAAPTAQAAWTTSSVCQKLSVVAGQCSQRAALVA